MDDFILRGRIYEFFEDFVWLGIDMMKAPVPH